MRLIPIADDLWELPHHFRMPGGIPLPLRMTVWRLPGGRLTLHSPVPIDDAVAAELAALGEVTDVIAPNKLHTTWFAATCARYPDARAWAPRALDDRSPWPEVDVVPLAGVPRIGETVFFHHASATLICTDLLFRVTRPANLRARLMLWLDGAGGGRLAVGRLWRLVVKDRGAARASVERMLAWPTARIVMAHGDVVAEDGAARLREASLHRVAGRLALSGGPRRAPADP